VGGGGNEEEEVKKGKGKEREVIDLDATMMENGGEAASVGVVEKGAGIGGGEEEEEQEVWVMGGSEDGRVIGWEVQSRKVVLDLQASSGEFTFVSFRPSIHRSLFASR